MALGIIACAVLLAVSVAAVSRRRELPFRSRLLLMLFPASLVVMAAIGLKWADDLGLESVSLLVALTALACCPIIVFLFRALAEAQMAGMRKDRLQLLEQQRRTQVDYRRALEADSAQIQAVRASILAELDAASENLERHRTAQMREGLANAIAAADSVAYRFCGDRAVDAAVALKARECERWGIAYDFALFVPEDCPIPSVETSAVLSNLLDNAIAATVELMGGEGETGEPGPTATDGKGGIAASDVIGGEVFRIAADAALRKGYLTISVRNPVGTAVAQAAGRSGMQVVKAERKAESAAAVLSHGWGMAIVAGLAERRGGRLSVGVRDGEFVAQVVMECR